MSGRYKVSITVTSRKGTCAQEHKVGDCWVVDRHTPGGICLSAFNSLTPTLRTLTYGGSFPWRDDPDTATVACTDASSPVVFELRRLRE